MLNKAFLRPFIVVVGKTRLIIQASCGFLGAWGLNHGHEYQGSLGITFYFFFGGGEAVLAITFIYLLFDFVYNGCIMHNEESCFIFCVSMFKVVDRMQNNISFLKSKAKLQGGALIIDVLGLT